MPTPPVEAAPPPPPEPPNVAIPFPSPPIAPPDRVGQGTFELRYEDVTQDGRLTLTAIPTALGPAIWPVVSRRPGGAEVRAAGIVPVLTRLVVQSLGGPIGVRGKPLGRGVYELAHAGDGEARKLLLRLWTTLEAPRGRTYGPPPDGEGEPIAVGRVFAEHVFTRLFAPKASRRVLAFEVEGVEPVPATRVERRPPETSADLPEGAAPIDDDLSPEGEPIAFGLAHTDSNRHVNSLVYPRHVEEAALRRLASRGLGAARFGSALEIAYRKPTFAGDRLEVRLALFRLGGTLGARAILTHAETGAPHAYARLLFDGPLP